MGAICSKPSHHTGGHTLVSSTDAQPRASAAGRPRPQQPSQPPQGAEARRSQAAAAAERRIKAVSPPFPPFTMDNRERSTCGDETENKIKLHFGQESKRGVTTANPNSGQLAARLEASKSAPLVPEPRQEAALIWD
ncbi:hypothetical protein H4582DRAFT_1914399 [Lactarius indigo]|nr:hypothetical protein H4582DRAFT_1914399 [Lactarius indigo]